MSTQWLTRAENGADISTIREITLAAFPTDEEVGMIDALRTDPAWIDGLSQVATDADDRAAAGRATRRGGRVADVLPAVRLRAR